MSYLNGTVHVFLIILCISIFNLFIFILFTCSGHHEAFPFLHTLSLGGVASLRDSDVSLLLTPPDHLHPHGSTPSSSSSSSSSRGSRSRSSSSSSDPVLLEVGARLQALTLRECPLLTDRSLASIRTHCRTLNYLDLSHLPLLTTPSLVGLFMQVGGYSIVCVYRVINLLVDWLG